MALAASPAKFADSMDPHEVLDWTIPCTNLLEAGEEIASFVLTPYAEATALGIDILATGDGYPDPAITGSGKDVTVWFAIDVAYQDNVAFDGSGTDLPFNIHLETDAAYPRERDRDIALTVVQRGV